MFFDLFGGAILSYAMDLTLG